MRKKDCHIHERSSCRWGLGFFFFLFLALFNISALGIVVSDDPNLHVATAASEYNMVGTLNSAGGTSGTLIGPWHVLTAAHCVRGYSAGTFTLDLPDGRHTYNWTSEGVVIHPTADLAVIKLTDYVGMKGYDLFTGTNEVGLTCILAGYGMSGLGSAVGAGGDPNFPKGIKRFGYNRIDSISSSTLLNTDFDTPTSTGTYGTLGVDKEVMMGDGDSGGPMFINDNGTLKLAGVHSIVLDFNGSGKWPDYGDRARDVRISPYVSWINDLLPLPGDTNLDGVVNDADLNTLMEHWGKTDATWPQGDFNCDRAVDALDLNILLNNLTQ
ncbi:MAG: trypsin-like serine protease [Phycisphaerae bacterium]